ncbi:pyridoxal phosphate-dependent aminotransferase [Kurthia sibirica]|uniref:Aminotransferase n=1 Tax=Kurthia sibirica TaxID=202750 RepID=A0A2U3AKU8_9BACL|nr:aminotransferase class I/II-fold pyridoxal phosphate-dependent enzyme [Kurthia sibirica]PWI25140.1 threonine-phosphate decarboxylase [Kurthia sibirica]GEK33224.1 threonine-phosphate decarboxylase [Kurthia sibirica]
MLPNHGANPQLIFEKLKIPLPTHINDFSENINFAGIPQTIQQGWNELLPLIEKYPHPDGEPFRSAIADYHAIEKKNVFVGNGAAEIFTLLANVLAHKKVIIVHPTFSEYEQALKAHHAEIIHITVENIVEWQLPIERLKRQMIKADALFLCTPNNPTGVLPPRQQLLELLAWGQQQQCLVILDEAFIDWVDEKQSLIVQVANNDYLCITRSMTKMYSIAGLRLGYAVTSQALVTEMGKYASQWHVNALSAVIGVQCLGEQEYVAATIEQCTKQRRYFTEFLQKNGCITTNSCTNFICFQLPQPEKSQTFYLDMLLKGIIVRHTENFRGLDGQWFRIGMKTSEQMALLEMEMTQWLTHQSFL